MYVVRANKSQQENFRPRRLKTRQLMLSWSAFIHHNHWTNTGSISLETFTPHSSSSHSVSLQLSLLKHTFFLMSQSRCRKCLEARWPPGCWGGQRRSALQKVPKSGGIYFLISGKSRKDTSDSVSMEGSSREDEIWSSGWVKMEMCVIGRQGEGRRRLWWKEHKQLINGKSSRLPSFQWLLKPELIKTHGKATKPQKSDDSLCTGSTCWHKVVKGGGEKKAISAFLLFLQRCLCRVTQPQRGHTSQFIIWKETTFKFSFISIRRKLKLESEKGRAGQADQTIRG